MTVEALRASHVMSSCCSYSMIASNQVHEILIAHRTLVVFARLSCILEYGGFHAKYSVFIRQPGRHATTKRAADEAAYRNTCARLSFKTPQLATNCTLSVSDLHQNAPTTSGALQMVARYCSSLTAQVSIYDPTHSEAKRHIFCHNSLSKDGVSVKDLSRLNDSRSSFNYSIIRRG